MINRIEKPKKKKSINLRSVNSNIIIFIFFFSKRKHIQLFPMSSSCSLPEICKFFVLPFVIHKIHKLLLVITCICKIKALFPMFKVPVIVWFLIIDNRHCIFFFLHFSDKSMYSHTCVCGIIFNRTMTVAFSIVFFFSPT